MTRINDNLFTTLLDHAVPKEFGCPLPTRFGWMQARFVPDGLAELAYVSEQDSTAARPDPVFAEAFQQWLDIFEGLPAADRWTYLAPSGTVYQLKVWRELLSIRLGQQLSYGELARRIGQPQASRAVGTAVAANPICLLLPCHRVVQASGSPGAYRWGAERKRALLDAEAVRGTSLRNLFQ